MQARLDWLYFAVESVRYPFNIGLLQNVYSYFVGGSKLQTYATRPKGGMGIHWNSHMCS